MQNDKAHTKDEGDADAGAAFRQRLTETIAWCASRASLSDPAGCLRTTNLRPSNYEPWHREEQPYNGRYQWGTPDEAHATVNDLAQRRADLLLAEGAYPPNDAVAETGRLVVLFPEESGHYGLTASETKYYMDDGDMFPWDTWVWCDSNIKLNYNGYMDLTLFCWVPTLFLPAVEAAMRVDPHRCFLWAHDYEQPDRATPFARVWADVGGALTEPPSNSI